MKRKEGSSLAYQIDDTPPWYLSVVLGFQVPHSVASSRRSYGIIYSSSQLHLFTCLLALLDDVRFNTGHTSCFSQAHVL